MGGGKEGLRPGVKSIDRQFHFFAVAVEGGSEELQEAGEAHEGAF